MWIGSTKENKAKPLGIKWPNQPIKALGVYHTYDVKLLREKNFIEDWIALKSSSISGPREVYPSMAS